VEGNRAFSTFSEFARNGLGAPILLVMLLAMIVIPLPTILLDIFFTFNIALSLIVMMVVVYVSRPLDFSLFPTVLLIATLLRLALNVASTRIILLEGHAGGAAAGKVIESFGSFVIGGNYAVGLVVFLILVVINFVVVTKGAGRVSEVSARFTLDAMPGKQMAIDADLNAGLITNDEARERRTDVSNEADFYGSMDGASKFVRGDAIAGILILVINIIGGLGIGMAQHNLTFATAMNYYTLLTIGDGLVAQIPSLLLSTATAIIITRVSARSDMGDEVMLQLLSPKALGVSAAVMGGIGIIPGMPNFAFLSLAALLGGGAYYLNKQRLKKEQGEEGGASGAAGVHGTPGVAGGGQGEPMPGAPEAPKELGWDDVGPVDMIGLEVGYRLIPLVDSNQGGQLMTRIKGVRKKVSQDLGFLVHSVHIRDNLDLAPNVYRISLMGVPVGEAEIQPEREMAINPGQVFGSIEGIPGRDPAFGLEAVWIEPGLRDQAQTMGYTVVDPSTVVATHLSQILQDHGYELLGHEEVQQLLNGLAKNAPKLVEDLVPKLLPLGTVLKVLQNLLREKVPIRDIRTIAETLAQYAPAGQDADFLTGMVRSALGRLIIQQINGMDVEVPVITLDPGLEQLLQQTLQAGPEGAGIEPGLAERLHQSLVDAVQRQEVAGQPAILLAATSVRTWLSRFLRPSIPSLHVLAYNEIPENKQIKVVASVGQVLEGAPS